MSAPPTPRPTADISSAATGPLTVDRYLAALYPRYAWEAMVRLGDASTAGRLVERVLHRAWRERERFAAADALLRHAAESAEAAIAREEARRLSVTRFDPEDGLSGLPGDLSPLGLPAVVERLRTGRAPAPTPAGGAPTVRAEQRAEPMAESVSKPVAEPVAEPVAPPPAVDAGHAPSLEHTGMHRANGRARWAMPPEAPDATRPSTAPPRAATAEHPRPTLRSASYIAAKSPRRLTPRHWAAVAGVAVVAATLAWRLAAPAGGAEAARRAAADTTAASVSTGRGERRDTMLTPGLLASMGPSSLVRIPAAVSSGVRGLAAEGIVSIEAALDSAHPVVLLARGQRLEWMGGRVSLVSAGDTVLVFAESADLTHYASAATRIVSGQTVRIGPDGTVEGLGTPEASARFSWRTGRLVTGRTALTSLRPVVGTWFGLDLESTVTDSLTLDVPLDSAEALVTALADSGRFAVTRSGTRVTVAKAAPVARPVRRTAPAPAPEPELPVLRRLPGIPQP